MLSVSSFSQATLILSYFSLLQQQKTNLMGIVANAAVDSRTVAGAANCRTMATPKSAWTG